MNEKVKNFFAIIGVFFAAAVALFLAILAGRRNGNSDKNGMAAVKEQFDDIRNKFNDIAGAQAERKGFESERKGFESERERIESERERIESERERIDNANAAVIAECKSIIETVEKRNAKN